MEIAVLLIVVLLLSRSSSTPTYAAPPPPAPGYYPPAADPGLTPPVATSNLPPGIVNTKWLAPFTASPGAPKQTISQILTAALGNHPSPSVNLGQGGQSTLVPYKRGTFN